MSRSWRFWIALGGAFTSIRLPMKSYNIAVMGGDGTGPEVVKEAVKVLDASAQKFSLKLNYTNYDLGGERYLRTKEALPDSAVLPCL